MAWFSKMSVRDPLKLSAQAGSILYISGDLLNICRSGDSRPFTFILHVYDRGEVGQAVEDSLSCVIVPDPNSTDTIQRIQDTEVITLPLDLPVALGSFPEWVSMDGGYCHVLGVLKDLDMKYIYPSIHVRPPFEHNHRYQVIMVGVRNQTAYDLLVDSLSISAPVTGYRFWEDPAWAEYSVVEVMDLFFTAYSYGFAEVAIDEVT